jgi:DNA-binding protein YbaB
MRRLDELDAYVRELEAKFQRHADAAEAVAEAKVDYRIPGDLGRVRMTAAKQLLAIELDAAGLRYTTAKALGAQLLAAVKAAETQADAARVSRLGR